MKDTSTTFKEIFPIFTICVLMVLTFAPSDMPYWFEQGVATMALLVALGWYGWETMP